MKLIKLMLAGMVVMSFALAQDDTQGGQPTGPPPCDEWLNSDMAQDMNGDGVVDEGDCPGSGPPPFEEVDTNGDGSIDREEARAMFGHDDEGNPDPNFDEEYDKIDTNGDGEVDHAEYMASDGGDHDGGGTCDVCGHEYGGEGDHHGHCRVCGAEMNSDDDWRAHCDENWEHCKPQAGDTCGYVGPSGDECGYVHTGDPDEDHHHCDTCGMPVNSGAEMEAHCNENPEHCHGDDGPPPFEEVDANGDGSIDREEARDFFGDEPNFDEEYDKIDTNGDGEVDHAEYMASDGGDGSPPNNHWDGNCAALCGGHGEYWLDSDGDGQPEDGPYATWDHDADGNPVDCGCGGDDGDHEGGGYDNLGGDTSWADAAYQIDGNQEHYDIVMSVPEADREKVYEDIKRDVEEHRGDHEGDEGDEGDEGEMTPVMHRLEGINGFLNDMMEHGNIDQGEVDHLMNEADRLEGAVHNEHSEAGCEGCAGQVLDEIGQWLNNNVEDDGVKDHYMRELCKLEYEAHSEHGPMDGPPACGQDDDGNN